MKKLLAFLLATLMLVLLAPLTVFATTEFEEKAITIADIIATYENFPLTKDEDLYWTNKQGTTCYYFNNNLFFRYTSAKSLMQSMTVSVAADGKNYTYSDGTVTYTFIMDDSGVLAAITVSGSTDTKYNGTYGEQHSHSFTYTVNGSKLTATCTEGCDKGYDTTPITLTLTAPASLVYDGNTKTFTFADGEADAWTNAGLELPTIYYYEKKDYPFYMGIDSAPTDAGGDYMVEITVNKKAAQIYFTIDKATPYIKTTPAPNDIEYGKKLSDSTLFGGYAQVSSTDSNQVVGLFEWKLGDTIPALSDSETTEYDVIFTPADVNNYNIVSCKVTIGVIHIHNLIKVTGQAATETAAGFKDYYECDCSALFEDENGNTPIENLDAWKSSTGNGYLAAIGEPANPQTGDSTNLGLWIALAAVFALGAVICIKKSKN